jgi:hypothetical protein
MNGQINRAQLPNVGQIPILKRNHRDLGSGRHLRISGTRRRDRPLLSQVHLMRGPQLYRHDYLPTATSVAFLPHRN